MIGYTLYLTANGFTPGGCSTVHIYTQTIRRTTQSPQTIHRIVTILKSPTDVHYITFSNFQIPYSHQTPGDTGVKIPYSHKTDKCEVRPTHL